MRGIHVILGGVHDFAKALPPRQDLPRPYERGLRPRDR